MNFLHFLVYFYRLKKCSGVPKLTNIRYTMASVRCNETLLLLLDSDINVNFLEALPL